MADGGSSSFYVIGEIRYIRTHGGKNGRTANKMARNHWWLRFADCNSKIRDLYCKTGLRTKREEYAFFVRMYNVGYKRR